MDDYRDSFQNEIPSLKTDEERKAVRAAVLRFISEVKQQIIDIASSKNKTKVVTGEYKVGTAPITIMGENPERRIAYIKNTGTSMIKIYGIDDNTNGGFTLAYSEQVTFHGTNSIQAVTLSGMSLVNYLDS